MDSSRALATEVEPLDSASWHALWAELGAVAPEGAREEVLARYAEPHRAYHTIEHLRECLSLWREYASQASHPAEVGLALWYHDAIYDTVRHDNEACSAELWAGHARAAGLKEPVVARVQSLVWATAHATPPSKGDASLLVDIDLAVLGASPERFSRYDRDIREEYRWVPEDEYRAGRSAVLGSLLARSPLYSTPAMRNRFERAARMNLEAALVRLAPVSRRHSL